MIASKESVSVVRAPAPDRGARLLVCAPNWLGDTVMALPAVRALCRSAPPPALTVLCKPSMVALWSLFPETVRVEILETGLRGLRRTVRRLRAHRPETAVILPNSFRSALAPFLAGVPVRRGFAGHWRRWMLTSTAPAARLPSGAPAHQSLEYAVIAQTPLDTDAPGGGAPDLAVPENLRLRVAGKWGRYLNGSVMLMFPGAARGPSKRWPAESFAGLGRRWLGASNGSVLVAGAPAERGLCEAVARGIGDRAVNLSGKTSLPELAALATLCSVAVGNDSGGVHLSAALGVPVAVVFGSTDPEVTAPRGRHVRIVTAAAPPDGRRIRRNSARAQALLAAIPVDAVLTAARAAMEIHSGKRKPAHEG